MAGLLIGMIGAFTWAAYRGVKESALAVGRERLAHLTQQIADMSQQSTAVLLGKTFAAASEPGVRGFLQAPSADTRSSAARALQQFNATQDPSRLQVELWSGRHSLVLTEPEGPHERANLKMSSTSVPPSLTEPAGRSA